MAKAKMMRRQWNNKRRRGFQSESVIIPRRSFYPPSVPFAGTSRKKQRPLEEGVVLVF
ncbi:MAG: hypothetical protein K0S28_2354 [Paucimonas sp.]|nr:hypothetical protein [Paucimonas sp.]